MSLKGKAYIAGIFEHPIRRYQERPSMGQLHAECMKGVLADAGLEKKDIDGYFCSGEAPGGAMSMVHYLGLRVKYAESTWVGGSSPMYQVEHAAAAVAAGKCKVALVTLCGFGASGAQVRTNRPATTVDTPFERPFGLTIASGYAMAARRHMHEYGTTSEQLAWIKVSASQHAQHNPHAFLKKVITLEDVLNSPMMADPLHRMDCCVVTDGGGSCLVVSPEVARSLKRPKVKILGAGQHIKTVGSGAADAINTGAQASGPIAFAEAGVRHSDIKYASIYDSYTITVLMTLEDLGFCKKGEGGKFVSDGNLISGQGKFPINTDGGGMCNNHPGNGGGMVKICETVRQLRGESHPKVQVPNCDIALAHGTGGGLATRHASSTIIMARE